MRKLFITYIAICFTIFCCAQPVLNFTSKINNGLQTPVDIVVADGSNKILIAELNGTIKLFDKNYNLLNANFLTIKTNISKGGERGLLSLALHPNFNNNGYFFVYYTNGTNGINIDRYKLNPDNDNQADSLSRTTILTIPKPIAYTNHNGGKLNFGKDGNLYFATGDGGGNGDPRNFAQQGDSLWGKMIRIKVDNFNSSPYYTIPLDNPFINNGNVRAEIFAFGLQNPWRWSFDRLNGDLWLADLGQNAGEEINYVKRELIPTANFGWRCYDGTSLKGGLNCLPPSAYTMPIFEYPHNTNDGGFAVVGGYVYRGLQFPAMYGYYICSDFFSGNGWVINANTKVATLQKNIPTNIVSWAEKTNGELLAISSVGVVYEITTNSLPLFNLNKWDATAMNGYVNFEWQTQYENLHFLSTYQIEFSEDGINFNKLTSVVTKNATSSLYNFRFVHQAKKLYYRLKLIKQNNSFFYSAVITIDANTQSNPPFVLYNSTNKIILNTNTNKKVDVNLVTSTGQKILFISNYQQTQIINLNHLPKGVYLVIASGDNILKTGKVIVLH